MKKENNTYSVEFDVTKKDSNIDTTKLDNSLNNKQNNNETVINIKDEKLNILLSKKEDIRKEYLNKFTVKTNEYEKEKEKIKNKYVLEMKPLLFKLIEYRKTNDNKHIAFYQEQIDDLKNDMNEELEELKDDYNNDIEKLKEEKDDNFNKLKNNYEKEKQYINNKETINHNLLNSTSSFFEHKNNNIGLLNIFLTILGFGLIFLITLPITNMILKFISELSSSNEFNVTTSSIEPSISIINNIPIVFILIIILVLTFIIFQFISFLSEEY